jgi:hypothetical protein
MAVAESPSSDSIPIHQPAAFKPVTKLTMSELRSALLAGKELVIGYIETPDGVAWEARPMEPGEPSMGGDGASASALAAVRLYRG